jgi:hypothetical protein
LASLVAGLAVLAAASYMAISLITTGSVGLRALQLPGAAAGPQQRHGYEVIQPTEVPQTLPDMVGPVVAIKDQGFTIQSQRKALTSQNVPTTEIVIAADTKVYQDITTRDTSSVVDGKLQMRVAPYAYNQIKLGDVLTVWGDQRGDRLVAQAVIVEVSKPATPVP